ncbi:NlpC/P60 family protein [Streptomyces sp. NPDC057249]|uniref:C40 family peptidase n=1 Tax=Streptomyces sp. NPDC057249 TaxID=3346067 RepID=UPI0036394112
MRAATTAYVGVGATAAVLVAGLVQAAAEDTAIGQALGVSVPAEYRALVEDAGQTCPEISPNLLAALIQQESGFDPRAESEAGAQGIAQFKPSTWESSGIDGNEDGVRDVFDPEDAIPSAGKYLCQMAEETKDVPGNRQDNMLAAYNAGPGKVHKYNGVPPYKETETYVKSIGAMAEIPTGETAPTTDQAATAINAASDEIGTPYSWGGGNASGASTGTCCSPNGSSGKAITGFDCSGLTLYAYAQAGISLPRTAAQQYAASEPVKPGDTAPGDLVFYGSSAASIHHVGIYIGSGYMIEAPRPGVAVRIASIYSMHDLYAVARPVRHANEEI